MLGFRSVLYPCVHTQTLSMLGFRCVQDNEPFSIERATGKCIFDTHTHTTGDN